MSDHRGAALNDGKPQYSKRLTWVIIRIAWGAMSYAYSGSIIGTTLGMYDRLFPMAQYSKCVKFDADILVPQANHHSSITWALQPIRTPPV